MERTLLRNDANSLRLALSLNFVLRRLPSFIFHLSDRISSFRPICAFHSATGSCVTKWAMPFYPVPCSVLFFWLSLGVITCLGACRGFL
jgi:hypothetical protein